MKTEKEIKDAIKILKAVGSLPGIPPPRVLQSKDSIKLLEWVLK